MPSGDAYSVDAHVDASPLSDEQRRGLSKIVQRARQISGYAFAVYVGPLADGRPAAVREHAKIPDATSAVLVAVDPGRRSIEIVTGLDAATALDNRACELAALSMKSNFGADDLVGGIREGVNLLAEHARSPRVLHVDDV